MTIRDSKTRRRKKGGGKSARAREEGEVPEIHQIGVGLRRVLDKGGFS